MLYSITTSVLVIDHNRILLEGIACLIGAEPDMSIVGTAANLRDGLELALNTHPACVVIDLDIQSDAVLEVLRSLHEACPAVVIIGLITYELDDRVPNALAAGVAAALGKDQISEDLVALIREHVKNPSRGSIPI